MGKRRGPGSGWGFCALSVKSLLWPRPPHLAAWCGRPDDADPRLVRDPIGRQAVGEPSERRSRGYDSAERSGRRRPAVHREHSMPFRGPPDYRELTLGWRCDRWGNARNL